MGPRHVYLLFALLSGPTLAGAARAESYPQGVAYTERFAFEVLVEPSPALEALTDRADEVYRYVSDRLRVSHSVPDSGRIGVTVERRADEPCPARGGFIPDGDDGPSLVIYADESTGPDELLGILAHELGRLLHAGGFGEFPSSAGLNEGLATWAAGRYWLLWQHTLSFAESVRVYRAQGTYTRLEDTLGFGDSAYRGAGCLARRTRLYTEWAAFTDFLIGSYGVTAFRTPLASADLFVTEAGEPTGTLPDYRATYGLTLAQLEAAWLEYLR